MADLSDDLLARRRALYTRWKALRDDLKSAEADLRAMDRVLRLVAPTSGSAISVERPRGQLTDERTGRIFSHGQLAPSTLAALKEIGKEATSAEVAVAMLQAKGLEPDDPRLPGLANRVSSTLSGLVDKGSAVRVGLAGDGRDLLWKLANT